MAKTENRFRGGGTEGEDKGVYIMIYIWDENLETGHPVIDNQHRQLVEAVNTLQAANLAGKGAEEIASTMEFLIAYTIKHFQDEEKLQLQYHYPNYAEHKSYHEAFKKQVKKLAQQMSDEGPLPELVEEVSRQIGDWLLNHIKGDDFKMAAYIKSMDTRNGR
jgi:hemerythrin